MRENLFLVIGYSLLYFLSLVWVWKRYKDSSIGKLLFLIYFISSICGVLEYGNQDSMIDYQNITLFPFLYLFLCNIIISRPVYKFRNDIYIAIESVNLNRLNLFLSVLLIIVWSDFIHMFSYYTSAFYSLLNPDSFADIYIENVEAARNKTDLGTNYLHVITAAFFNVLPFLFFYYSTLNNGNKVIRYGLLFSLLLPLLSTIAGAGRNGLVVFLLLLLSNFLLFNNFFSSKRRRTMKRVFVGFVLFIVLGMVAITVVRFSTGIKGDNSTLEAVISYAGQGALNFNEYVLYTEAYSHGDNTFPLFRMLLGLDFSNTALVRQENWGYKMGIPVHIFYTLVGDFVLDYGPFLTVFMLVLFSCWVVKCSKVKSSGLKLHHVYVVYFWFNTCAEGIFYFMDKTFGGNFKIVVFILMYFFIKFFLYGSSEKA